MNEQTQAEIRRYFEDACDDVLMFGLDIADKYNVSISEVAPIVAEVMTETVHRMLSAYSKMRDRQKDTELLQQRLVAMMQQEFYSIKKLVATKREETPEPNLLQDIFATLREAGIEVMSMDEFMKKEF